jgi:hypothetical protein
MVSVEDLEAAVTPQQRRDCPRGLAGPQGKDRGHRGAVPRDVTLSDKGRDGAGSDELKAARIRCAGGCQGSLLERECEVGVDMVSASLAASRGAVEKTADKQGLIRGVQHRASTPMGPPLLADAWP